MVLSGLLTWGPSYLAQVCSFDVKGIGAATSVIFLHDVVGPLVGDFLCDLLIRRGVHHGLTTKGPLAVPSLVVLIAFLLLPSLEDTYAAVTLLALTTFSLMWSSLYWNLPVLFTASVRVNLIGGVIDMAGSLGGIAMSVLVRLLL